jgi:hypothetical protein
MNKEIDFPLKIDDEGEEISVDKDDFGLTVRIPEEFRKYVKLAKYILVGIGMAMALYGYTLVVP